MNNNIFAHVYRYAERSKAAAYAFRDKWKSVIVSTKSRSAAIVEFTMKNNDVHVFLPDSLYSQWCLGRTYYMDGILYRGEYPYNRPIQKENNMETLDIEIETQKARKDGYETAMEEAHEYMVELCGLDYNTRESIFGDDSVDDIVKNYDIRTIIGKLYAYEQKRAMIGKEYVHTNGKEKVIITDILDSPRGKYVHFLKQSGTTDYLDEKNFSCKFKETGKSYPGLVAFLDKVEWGKS